MIPAVAASNEDKRIALLKRNAKWRSEYTERRGNHKAGRPRLLPEGGVLLARIYGVPVVEPP